jgi:pentatricopeptide repeat protein
MDGTDAGLIYASCAAAKPDRITYGSLIAALERGGQWERALALFEEMQAAGIQVGVAAAAQLQLFVASCERECATMTA